MPEIRIKRKVTIKTKLPHPTGAAAPRAKKSKKWLWGLLLLPILAGVAYLCWPKGETSDERLAQETPESPVPPPIEMEDDTTAVVEEEIEETPEPEDYEYYDEDEDTPPAEETKPGNPSAAGHRANTESFHWGRTSNFPNVNPGGEYTVESTGSRRALPQTSGNAVTSFLKDPKYETLTPQNLCGFISEWKAYSQLLVSNTQSDLVDLASSNEVSNGILASQFNLPSATPCVVMQRSIPVDYKTASEKKTGYITPKLPKNGVYLTPEVTARLEQFISEAETPGERDRRLEILSQFINVRPNNTGYTFLSFPAVTRMAVTDDAVVVYYRATNTQGCQLTYNKVGDKLVPDTQLRNIWSE